MDGVPVSVSDVADTTSRVESLFLANERRLGQFLVQMVRDRALAEDLLQETFEAVLRSRNHIDHVDNVDAWLFGIARHRALQSMRGGRRMQRAVERLWARGERAESENHGVHEVLDVLERTLTPDDRSLVVLRYVHGFDAPALAELTGRTPAAVRKRLERACESLKKEIER
jgi:RNA polymerase sigma-70 factor, ECF subfamily